MKILALNAGSSSIKYSLFDASKNYHLLAKGLAERIGQEHSSISHWIGDEKAQKIEMPLPDHRAGMIALYDTLATSGHDTFHGVGHRIVHGGEQLRAPTLINARVIDVIKEAAQFAPLHCHPNIIGIEVLQELQPNIPHVAIFDTAAHEFMPPKAFLYGIPLDLYEKHKIRKYGFHGINHQYVANKAAVLLSKPLADLKVITCHLGNGCSITAFENGRSVDNSMGLTPLEGLVMGSRCGDIDPSVVLYLVDVLGLSTVQVTELLNKKSGLLGLCGKNDMRDIITMVDGGDTHAQTAIDIFVYRIHKTIGAYIAALNGVDVIVFSGGIGENSPLIRTLVAKNFSYVGASLDIDKNQKNADIISKGDSRVVLMTIPANEEMVIAQQCATMLTEPQKRTNDNNDLNDPKNDNNCR